MYWDVINVQFADNHLSLFSAKTEIISWQVVAVAGGVTYKFGQGMEFWNPDDGSVTVVVDQLPTEIGSLTPLQVAFVIIKFLPI